MSVVLDGKKVREARINAGYTINDLAAQCGVSRWTISRTERGLTGMSIHNARTLSEQLGVSLRSLRLDTFDE